jgi:hypothetical protein
MARNELAITNVSDSLRALRLDSYALLAVQATQGIESAPELLWLSDQEPHGDDGRGRMIKWIYGGMGTVLRAGLVVAAAPLLAKPWMVLFQVFLGLALLVLGVVRLRREQRQKSEK